MGIRINMENQIDSLIHRVTTLESQARGMVSVIEDLKDMVNEVSKVSTKKVKKNETKKSNKKAVRTSDDSIDKGHTDSKSKTE
tara:strand:- start:5822 stop:6070 length:249 start_codon:yes stop_codon:yes gene_type:complete